jgi:succinoglycan biosynthesis transport protein ExoP
MNKQPLTEPLTGTRKNKPFDPIGFLQRFGAMAVVFSLFFLTMLVPLVLKLKKPDYEVNASLKIDPVIPSLITKSEDPSITGFYHDYVRTQAKRIADEKNIHAALEKLTRKEPIKMLSSNLSKREKVAILGRLIKVVPVSRTHLINLSISGPHKEGLAPLLNNLMESYLENIARGQQDKDERRISYLKEKKERLSNQINSKEGELKKLASEMLSSTFVEDFNIWHKQVVALQSIYVDTFGKRVEAEKEYEFSLDTAEKTRRLSLDSLIEEGVMANDAIDFTSSWTYQKLQEMRGSIDGITENNADRRRIEHRMQAMREYEAKLRRETKDTVSGIVHGKQELELNTDLIEKKNRARQFLASEQDIKLELNRAKKVSGRKSAMLLQGKGLETDLTHDRNLLFRIDTRIHELEAESRAPLRINIESIAKEPQKPAGSNIKKLLMACIAISFGSVGSFFLLLEFLDNRIRTPKNIAQALGHPPSWPISAAPSGLPLESVLKSAPNSVTAKAVRSLATKLYREHTQHKANVLLFSGVERGCGTSSISDSIAGLLVQRSLKVLLVDPVMMQEQTASGQAILHDEQRGFDYLVGHFKDISSQEKGEVLFTTIREAKNRYDLVLLDCPPILSSDLTEQLATESDVAVLIAQGDSTTYQRLRHSAEILIRMEIPALAPVLNWGGPKELSRFEMNLNRLARFLVPFTPIPKK